MSKRYSGKSFKDSSVMKKAKLSLTEKRKIKKDKKKGKSTLIHLLGYKNAINYAYKLQKKILLKLKKHGKKG